MVSRLIVPLTHVNADRTRPRLPLGSKKIGLRGIIRAAEVVASLDLTRPPL